MAKKRNLTQIIGLFLFLIILPGGSWYYLQKGLDYQKDARAQLLDYGKLQAETALLSMDGQNIQLKDIGGKLSIFSFVTSSDLSAERNQTWNDLYDQFEETNRATFIMGTLDSTLSLATKTDLPQGENCLYVNTKSAQGILTNLKVPQLDAVRTEDGRYQTQKLTNVNQYPYYVLVDTNYTIRNYYRADDEAELKRMVEHIAMIMPREKSKKPVLIRDKEK